MLVMMAGATVMILGIKPVKKLLVRNFIELDQ